MSIIKKENPSVRALIWSRKIMQDKFWTWKQEFSLEQENNLIEFNVLTNLWSNVKKENPASDNMEDPKGIFIFEL